jgi:hypothetical protein
MSTKQFPESSGWENMRRNSTCATSFSSLAASRPICSIVASSSSSRASWKSSRASAAPAPTCCRVSTTASSDFFSLPSSWARCGLSHSLGSSSSRFRSSRRFCLPSKSKIPPQFDDPLAQAVERRGDLVDAFGFHWCSAKRPDYTGRSDRAAAAARSRSFSTRRSSLPVGDFGSWSMNSTARTFLNGATRAATQASTSSALISPFFTT